MVKRLFAYLCFTIFTRKVLFQKKISGILSGKGPLLFYRICKAYVDAAISGLDFSYVQGISVAETSSVC